MGGNRGDDGGGRVVLQRNVLFGADDLVIRWAGRAIPGFMPSPGAKALGVVHRGELVAGVIYERFNGVHMEVAITARKGARWATRHTLQHLFGYPFNQMRCIAISALVPASNLQSLNLALKLGFEAEAYVKFAAPDGSPMVVLKMYRDKCRWIHENDKATDQD
jgi:hypothetical protein